MGGTEGEPDCGTAGAALGGADWAIWADWVVWRVMDEARPFSPAGLIWLFEVSCGLEGLEGLAAGPARLGSGGARLPA